MIPRADITAWRARAPWPTDAQVEQDLVVSRALVELYKHPRLAESLLFRGGTALHKLCFDPAARYSEDIDLVQVSQGPIGEVLDTLRSVMGPWLGMPSRKFGEGRATLLFRFETTFEPVQPARLKIEINTREHFCVLPVEERPFIVNSRWFDGEARVRTYAFEELLGTKLRALYQRRKGRDLFDLWLALDEGRADPGNVVACFERYMEHGSTRVTRAMFEENLAVKRRDAAFLDDIKPLLAPGITYDPDEAMTVVLERLVSLLPGDPWQGHPPQPSR
jgi:predicted nucleotidyltransferase component of viral defense system